MDHPPAKECGEAGTRPPHATRHLCLGSSRWVHLLVVPLREEAIRADHRAALDAIGAADKLRGSAVAFRVVAGFYDRAVVRAWATWRVFDRAAQQAAAAARHKREAAAAREAHADSQRLK